MRRALALTTAAICFALALPAAADDAEPPTNRVLQWLGVGGSKPAEPAPPATPAQPEAPTQPSDRPSPTGQDVGNGGPGALGWLTFGRKGESGGKPKTLEGCPEIVIDGGGAEQRVPPGADAASVRYQLALGRMARDCELHGDQLSVRVGIEGSAMLGPTGGQGGSYYGDVRVALRRKSDAQLFGAKTYKVGAAIPAGAARGDFSLLVDDLSAPVATAKAAEDYEIIVGFASGGAAVAAKPARKKHKSR